MSIERSDDGSVTINDRETMDDLLDDAKEVGSSNWRHGRRVEYLVQFEGNPFLCEVDVHHSEGRQLYGRLVLVPAEEIWVKKWVRKGETQ